MMKIAIPVSNGQLSHHFSHSQCFYIYKTENNSISEENVLTLPPHEAKSYPKWLAENGVTDVIAEGIGYNTIAIFNQLKIHVFTGVPIKTPFELVMDVINGTLETSGNTYSHEDQLEMNKKQ